MKHDNIIVNLPSDFAKKKEINLEDVQVKIIDLNISRSKSSFMYEKDSKNNVIMYSITGTPQFSAPEILECYACYTEQVDIWSVGCVLYYLLRKKLPFAGNKYFLFKKVLRKYWSQLKQDRLS